MKLDIFEERDVPLDIVTQRVVVLGTSGAGKTSGQRSLAERVWRTGKLRFGVIDLAEDWWGLKSSADGNSPGIPVVIFGGDHADVPLPSDGKRLAAIVTRLEQPWIADLKALAKPQRLVLIADLFMELLRTSRGNPMVLFCDEADSYAAETVKSKEGQKSLDATEEVVKRGRKQGIFPVLITQRNGEISKSVVDLAQVALLYRAPGVRDQKVAIDYLGHSVKKEAAEYILQELESLPDGQCFLVSKAPKIRIPPIKVTVRQPTTFDSSATPELGKRRREPKVMAEPDLEKLRDEMAREIERAEAEDASALRRALLAVRQELKLEREKKPVRERVEVPVLKGAQLARVEALVKQMGALAARIFEAQDPLIIALSKVSAPSAASLNGNTGNPSSRVPVRAVSGAAVGTVPRPQVGVGERQMRAVGGAGVRQAVDRPEKSPAPANLSSGERKVLAVLAQYPDGRTAAQLTLLAGYTYSGTFQNILSRLRSLGLIEGPNTGIMRITYEGLLSGEFEPLPQGRALLDYWLGHRAFGTGERRVLNALIEAYPSAMTAEDLCRETGYSYSGTFQNILSKLRTAGVLVGKNTEPMRASETLFEGVA